MKKIILITGATDGIGRAAAEALAKQGHDLIIHGRSTGKLATTAETLRKTAADITTALADLSDLSQVAAMADQIAASHPRIDVLINNAGVFKTDHTITDDGLDVRFVVNTLAPALLTLKLLPTVPLGGRIIHLSSAAQAPVDLQALAGARPMQDMDAYAQSKLAITLWSQHFAAQHPAGPASIAVNPGSLLATKMVREGFGTSGNDLNIGVDILTRAALSDAFADATGRYFDNDARRFGPRYPEALCATVAGAVDKMLKPFLALR